jgi:hypothetical protein
MPRKKRKAPWIDRRCCDWDTFLTGLMGAAHRLSYPLILVNWCEARRYWRRYSCTGTEVIKMQRGREMNDALYNGYGEPPNRGGNSGNGGGTGSPKPFKPSPIKPFTLA